MRGFRSSAMAVKGLAVSAGLAVLGVTTPSRAAVITVPNPSFEAPDAADGANVSPGPTGWTAVNAGAFDPTNTNYAGTTGNNVQGALPDGGQAAFVFANGTAAGSLTSAASLTTIAADTTYTLTVAVGKELATGAGGRVGYNAGIALLANGAAIPAATLTGIDIPVGTFQDRTVAFTTAATGDPLVGQSLTIRLSQAGATAGNFPAPDFDNVRLDGSPVPEPASAGLLAVGGVGLLARRRRWVRSA
jgi:hypothetical protein